MMIYQAVRELGALTDALTDASDNNTWRQGLAGQSVNSYCPGASCSLRRPSIQCTNHYGSSKGVHVPIHTLQKFLK